MKQEKREPTPRLCATEGCRRPAETGDRFCENCAIEWALYRRDTRGRAPIPSPRPVG